MVVRLKDLQNGTQERERKGLVRLSDLKPKPDPEAESAKRTAELMRSGALPPVDVRQSELFQKIAKAPEPEPRPGRDLPVIGAVLRGLDVVEANEPRRKIGEFFKDYVYTPGAGVGAVAGLYRGAQSAISRALPGLTSTTGGRIAQEALQEGIVGVPLATGQTLAQTGELGESVKEGLLYGGLGGAVTGGAIRAAAPVVKRGLTRLRDLRTSRAPETPPVETPTRTQEAPITREAPMTRTTEQAPPRPNERSLVTTLRESERLTPEVRTRLEQSPSRTYQPITNRETVAKANARIASNIDEAESYVLGGTKRLDAEQVATGFRLIDEFQRAGNVARAVTMAERLAERLTEAGQAVQAASIWNRLTPEGALIAAQRKVNKINDSLPKGAADVVITEKNASDIMTAAQAIQRSGASQQRAADVMDILDRMKAGQSISDAEKQTISDFVKDAQQFVRPKTTAPRAARTPKELSEPRVRDRVVSFLDEAEKSARERIAARRGNINSLPLDEYADYAIIGASKLAKGAIKFADFSEQMIREFGEQVRPHLANIYERAQDVLAQNTKRISKEAVSQAERIAERYLTKHEANLQPQDIDLVRNLARSVSELSGDAKRLASQDLQAILNGFERAGIGKKLSSTQYIFMLLNPVTQIRNILGNEMLYRLERMARIVSTPIDMAASKLTGKDRQITFIGGPMTWENFFRPTADYWRGLIEGGRAGWRGVNPEGLTTAYDISGQAFRSKLNPLTYLERTLGAVMKGFDYAAYNRVVNQRLREMAYLDALNKGIRGRNNVQNHIDRYISNLDENIAKIAQDYGKYVTLQDDTALSRTLMGFRRGLNRITTGSKDFGAGSLVLPFARTPANLLMRAIDYSPAGVFKAIGQAYQILRNRNTDLTRADVISSVTRALFGSGIGATGLWLASKGVLRGESSSDRDVRELEKQAGLSQYQLNASALSRMLEAMVTGDEQSIDQAAKPQAGDTFWQYEWAQPSSIPLALGANIIQERRQAASDLKRKGETEGRFKQATDITLGALNTLMNTSVLQGLQQAFDLPPSEDNKIKAFAENLVRQIPGMLVPSMVNRVNMFFDPAVRETYNPDFLQSLISQGQSRIPGTAQELPQRIGTLGQPQTRENSFFDVFLSPSQRTQFKPSKEAKLVIDLLAETGDERLAPRAVPKYITGTLRGTNQQKRVDLTPEQLVKYQTIVGQETSRLLGRIPPNLSIEAKAKRVLDALNKAGEKGRNEMRRELGMKPGR